MRRYIVDNGRALGPHFYEKNATLFNKAFFIKNYIKCSAAISAAYDLGLINHTDAFNDIGAGAGTASLAIHHNIGAKDVVAIDTCDAQLKHAKRILSDYGANYLTIKKDALTYRPQRPEIVNVMSYLACELCGEFDAATLLPIIGNRCIIIDYDDINWNICTVLPRRYSWKLLNLKLADEYNMNCGSNDIIDVSVLLVAKQ